MNSPKPVFLVSYTNKVKQIAAVTTIYSIGIIGYPKALYGRSVSGSLFRKMNKPPMVNI